MLSSSLQRSSSCFFLFWASLSSAGKQFPFQFNKARKQIIQSQLHGTTLPCPITLHTHKFTADCSDSKTLTYGLSWCPTSQIYILETFRIRPYIFHVQFKRILYFSIPIQYFFLNHQLLFFSHKQICQTSNLTNAGRRSLQHHSGNTECVHVHTPSTIWESTDVARKTNGRTPCTKVFGKNTYNPMGPL